MKFEEFKTRVKGLPVITYQYLRLSGIYAHSLKIQLQRWQKTKRIIRLRKGVYILGAEERMINPSRLYVSRELCSPSYVSMEYALSTYGLIPERVADITCITTKKTMSYENNMGKFVYQHIKKECFTGFIEQKDETGLSYFIAVKEKAVADFIYLNQHRFKGDYRSVFYESFRFQNTDSLDRKKLMDYIRLFSSKKAKKIAEVL